MTRTIKTALAATLAIGSAGPAFAHHATGGMIPRTLGEGLLSGLAHPVIGLDHLAFLAGLGVLAALMPTGAILPVLFLVGSAAGVGLHLAGTTLPASEWLVAVSLAGLGIGLLVRPAGHRAFAPMALAGLIHGYALSESIVGAEPNPLGAYLAGLTASQLAVAYGVFGLVRALDRRDPAVAPRLAAGAAAIVLVTGIAVPFMAM